MVACPVLCKALLIWPSTAEMGRKQEMPGGSQGLSVLAVCGQLKQTYLITFSIS